MLTLDDRVPNEISNIFGWLYYEHVVWAELEMLRTFATGILMAADNYASSTVEFQRARLVTLNEFEAQHRGRCEAQQQVRAQQNRSTVAMMDLMSRIDDMQQLMRAARQIIVAKAYHGANREQELALDFVVNQLEAYAPGPLLDRVDEIMRREKNHQVDF